MSVIRFVGRVVVLLAVFAAAVGGGYWGYHQMAARRSTPSAPQNIRLHVVQHGTLQTTVNTTGSLAAASQVRLSFKTGGKVKEVNVTVGDAVKAGDVLARVDATDLEFALAQRLITLENNRLRLEQLKAGPKKEDITIAKVNLDKAALNLQKAQSDYDRVAWRNDIGMTPQAAALQQATLDYQTALANYAKATAGSAESDVQVQENAVKSAELQAAQDRANLQGATIVAPFDGVIASVGANVGEMVSAGAVMFLLLDPATLRLDANIDETDIGLVRVGQDVRVALDGLPDVQLHGKVSAIAPNGTMQSGIVTYQVQITLERNNETLRGGMTATANIVVEQRQNVLYVPNRAVRNVRNVRTVQVLEDDQLVEREVTVGLLGDENTEITAGLREGDEVIITLATTVRTASSVFGMSTGGR